MNRPSRSRFSWPLSASLLAGSALVASPVAAQEATGKLTGRVTEQGTGLPLAGITVVVQGPQGEDGTVTDSQGVYMFPALPVGTYTVHFYTATSAIQVETPPLEVSAQSTARANALIPSQTAATAATEQTYVIQKKASAIDVGSSRLGSSWDEKTIENMPLSTTTFDSLIEKAPGAFVDPSGSVSIGGASGIENHYVLDGVNITGLEYGELGTKLSSSFVKELQVNSAGYSAEYGGGMGGTINVVTKSGGNTPHGTAQVTWAPYWLSGGYHLMGRPSDTIVGQAKPDYDTEVSAEAGGAIIKDKLFWWAGFSGRFEKDHIFRIVRAGQLDANGDPALDSSGNPTYQEVQRDRLNFPKRFLQFTAKVDYIPQPGHRLTLSFVAAPTEQHDLHNLGQGQSPLLADPRWTQGLFSRDSYDGSLRYNGSVLDKHLELDAVAGLHREYFYGRSPFSDLNNTSQIWHQNADIYALEQNPGCASPASMPSFQPCGGAIGAYYSGGYGEIKDWTGDRLQVGLKATWRDLFGPVHFEVKGGGNINAVSFDQHRHYSGPTDDEHRILIYDHSSGAPGSWSFFSLPPDKYPYQFAGDAATTLASAPYYQSNLNAKISSFNTASFLQVSGTYLQRVTVNLGSRLETQAMDDSQGHQFINLFNLAPRLGLVVDPQGDGRTKVFAHYGQFYESIPANLAVRYFGGEGIVVPSYAPGSCTNDPATWKGTGGELAGCMATSAQTGNNGKDYPIQPNIKGQFNHEIALGVEHELFEDLLVGVDFTRRWLGRIIEDGTTQGTFVLANPGDIPESAINQVQEEAKAASDNAARATDPDEKERLTALAGDLQARVTELKGLQAAPKPERTYTALTVRADKRFSRYFGLKASYTYSRLIGNYNGLFDADNNYFAPNGSNFYDLPELRLNRTGPLANDRPHSGRLDGYTVLPVSEHGTLTFGLGFFARSGAPRNYQSVAYPGISDNFLLPRGAAGRTPTVWQMDGRIAYRHQVKELQIEAFVDLLNLFNQQAALQMDDVYTYDFAAAIVNGTKEDLKYAKNAAGQPITKNTNFGNALSYQAPFHARMGLRVLF